MSRNGTRSRTAGQRNTPAMATASTFSLLTPGEGVPGASASARASVAMFIERHRNALALGTVALFSLLLLGILFGPLFADTRPAVTEPVGPTALLEEAGVIPDVLDSFQPQVEVDLALGSRPVLDGANLPLDVAQRPPSVSLRPVGTSTSPSGFYVMVMVDPDAPSPSNPAAREWLHWIVTDIQPGVAVTPSESSVKHVVEYNQPTPPEGKHRYVFAVYYQPKEMPEIVTPEGRAKFNLRFFAKEHSLGEPVGAIYLTTSPN